MASPIIVKQLATKTVYVDRQSVESSEDQIKALSRTSTVYVGNISFFTTEEQIYEFFSQAGEIRRIIMGLDRNELTPCGFCFIEFRHRNDAERAILCLSGTKMDDRTIRVDWDRGFLDGRQYGRGRSGGQIRDEMRQDFDINRGGWSASRSRDAQNRNRFGGGSGLGGSGRGARRGGSTAPVGGVVAPRRREPTTAPRVRPGVPTHAAPGMVHPALGAPVAALRGGAAAHYMPARALHQAAAGFSQAAAGAPPAGLIYGSNFHPVFAAGAAAAPPPPHMLGGMYHQPAGRPEEWRRQGTGAGLPPPGTAPPPQSGHGAPSAHHPN
ncbi:hypothetical protein H696_00712 [Fonticula alba]|uniref:Nuclear cap-binding protein subunit 2 n=1 Tax=Fonticula alba TaxID=691883 RepID=A0A058ZFN7_FONAL|nr:hypothetical protein H696_00712 [Fonticula alba]KCV73169.1 hypothetical protein H696_00712 [Fonticula alba]|eukprot:XP_009492870.1 hypothetical protein H696_00712 [Fonticula alba]